MSLFVRGSSPICLFWHGLFGFHTSQWQIEDRFIWLHHNTTFPFSLSDCSVWILLLGLKCPNIRDIQCYIRLKCTSVWKRGKVSSLLKQLLEQAEHSGNKENSTVWDQRCGNHTWFLFCSAAGIWEEKLAAHTSGAKYSIMRQIRM